MPVPIVEVTRGEVVECVHRGDMVVASASGEVLKNAGDPEKFTYFRSSAKPIQALQVILSGADVEFGLTDAELAVICSSHYAEDVHLKAVRSILKKIGLDESYLRCGPAVSLKKERAIEMALGGAGAQPLHSDCSGKHSGMLAVCRKMGFSLEDYIAPSHPLQLSIRDSLSEICGYPEMRIMIGVDGCSAPVFAMPIRNMAAGFARFASLERLPEKYKEAASKIFKAMTEHPEMISGSGGFCTALIAATNGRLIGKVGAEGVYCVGLKDEKIGIAIKVEDGNMRALPPATVEALKQLKLLSPPEYEKLKKFHVADNRNDNGEVVGHLRPSFSLA
jgi:L-asparaginase II